MDNETVIFDMKEQTARYWDVFRREWVTRHVAAIEPSTLATFVDEKDRQQVREMAANYWARGDR